MPGILLITETDKLKQYHKTLSWFGRLFFPGQLQKELTSNALPLSITHAAFSSTWFFQRWFFSGLRAFFQSDVVRSSEALLSTNALPGGKERVTYNLDTLYAELDPEAVAAALFSINKANTFKKTDGSNGAQQAQDNINKVKSHPQRADLVGILILLDQANLLNGQNAQSNFNKMVNHIDQYSLHQALTQLDEGGMLRNNASAQGHFDTVCSSIDPKSAADTLLHREEDPIPQPIPQPMPQPSMREVVAEQVLDLVLRLNLLGTEDDVEAVRLHRNPGALQRAINTLRHRDGNALLTLQTCHELIHAQNPEEAADHLLHGGNRANEPVDASRESVSATVRPAQPERVLTAIQLALLPELIGQMVDLDMLNGDNDMDQMSNHRDLQGLRRAINSLIRSNLLTQDTFHEVLAANDPERAANVHVAARYREPTYVRREAPRREPNDESHNPRSAQALTRNTESSMRGLTHSEEALLAEVRTHYQPRLTALRVEGRNDPAFQALLTALRARYQETPAHIQVSGREVVLPLSWADFAALGLRGASYEGALTAYYQNKTHTALRYLNGPNAWRPMQSSAALGEHESLIGLLWLAASDAEMEPTNGFTLDGRISQFIDELALMGRAHNWDHNRDNGKGGREEYDDGLSDSPSCRWGVQSRIFQAVQGHPLFGLSPEVITQATNEYVREHFTRRIQALNPVAHTALLAAWDELAETGSVSGAHAESIAALNVTPHEQDAFIEELAQRYGVGFSTNPALSAAIRTSFLIEAPVYNSHVDRFAASTELPQLIEQARKEGPRRSVEIETVRARNRYGVFSSSVAGEPIHSFNRSFLPSL